VRREPSPQATQSDSDRRRLDRRSDFVRLSDYTVPELRKALVTLALLVVIVGLFLYMVSEVIVAVIAGVVAGVYLIPLQRWLAQQSGRPNASAILTIILFTVPLLLLLVYSWLEISGAAQYLERNSGEVAAGLNEGLRRLAWFQHLELSEDISRWVAVAAASSGRIAEEIREAVDVLLIGVSVFLFTTFYVLTDHARIRQYIADRVPGRYRGLAVPVAAHIRAVVYGALYGTFITQLLKSAIILAMNLAWSVPLAVVLAIASFFIGLLPVVGSWTIYTPVAAYLILWRGDVVGGILMLFIGIVVNTLIISMYLRPRIAAQKAQVLNFYWMFIALITGVYTFGLMGIIIGPVLIAVLKAVFDTISETEGEPLAGQGTTP
jgi:predicted PurR-regulated permease PerM